MSERDVQDSLKFMREKLRMAEKGATGNPQLLQVTEWTFELLGKIWERI